MSLDTELLASSFAQIRDRSTEFTDYFYSTLFADYPQVQPLFANTPMQSQAKKLFASLVLVVENLTNPDQLGDALTGLGARHVQYGILPEHYPMVGNTLLKTFAYLLQERWTPELEASWTNAYGAVTELMLAGANYSPEVLQLQS
ncbi:globin family protein [Acaryochloris sp. IP29b_bin.137]|uniref:globin family protein n=1 Tax=Acaryochloris sp. IP29b_bin.137 TaxID=2969217 RepID=UPI002636138E|nr:globin family protein [Acaryochloris sp. IP29b_bin.137]